MNESNKSTRKPNVKNVTSSEVARLAGVSQSSVSRVFNPKWDNKIKPETRKKILDVAQKLGYNPNAIARSLLVQETKIIGIVIPEIRSTVLPHYLNSFISKLQKTGRQTFVFTVEPGRLADDAIVQMLKYRVDGIIVISSMLSSEIADQCFKNNTPVILFNRYIPNINVSSVRYDYSRIGSIIADFLVDTGHKNIAYISGKDSALVDFTREKSFTDRLKERGITEWLTETGDYLYESGCRAAERLLTRQNPPDAIFCTSDTMALGVMDVARYKLGLSIPKDVSVIGVDDVDDASRMSYSLTTIRSPREKMINATIQLLEEQLEEISSKPISKVFEMELVIRNSVRISK